MEFSFLEFSFSVEIVEQQQCVETVSFLVKMVRLWKAFEFVELLFFMEKKPKLIDEWDSHEENSFIQRNNQHITFICKTNSELKFFLCFRSINQGNLWQRMTVWCVFVYDVHCLDVYLNSLNCCLKWCFSLR